MTFTVLPPVSQATPTVNVSDPGGTYNGSPFPASATVAGVNGNGGATLEGVSPTIEYYEGIGTDGTDLGSTAPTAADTYTVVASFAGSTDYTSAQSAAETFTIDQATPTVTVADAGGTYNGSPFPASATVTDVNGNAAATLEGISPTYHYYSGTGTGGKNLGSKAPTAAGTYTVVAWFDGSDDYTSAQSDPVTFTISPPVSKATPTVNVADAGGTYNGSAFPASATVTGQNGTAGSLEGVWPTYHYYAGTGTGGTNLGSTAPTVAGTYTVVASFAGSTDYTSAQSSPETFTISPATPTVTVTDVGGTYSGSPFPASATVTDANGNAAATLEGVSPTYDYYAGSGTNGANLGSTAPTAAGTYTVVASFAGSADYTSAQSAPATFTIAQAFFQTTPTVTVTDAGGTYNGSPFPATATLTDGEENVVTTLEGVSPTYAYYAGTGTSGTELGSTAPTAAGAYTVVASFAGSTDYTFASDSTTFTISQAMPTVAVTENGGTYNGSPFSASATVTGLSGPAAGTLEGVSPTFEYYVGSGIGGTDLGSTAPTAAGTYTVVASFAGSTDYTSASDSTTFTISQATPIVAVSDADGTYNDSPFSGSATVTGVSGPAASTLESVSPTFEYYVGSGIDGTALGSTAPTAAGTYTVVATFAGSTDYTSASDSTTFTISPATPTVAVSDADGTYNGSPFSASATVTGLSGLAAGTLEGVSPTFEYYQGSGIGGTDLGSTAPTAAGTYTVVATFADSTDYASASDSQTFTISLAMPTVAVTDADGTYNGSPFSASATVTGLSGPAASTLEGVSPTFEYYVGSGIGGADLGSTAPTAAGTYTVVATFAGSTDYASASDSQTFTISQATPTVAVTDNSGTYNGSPFSASATVTGLSGPAAATLEGVSPTFEYYVGSGIGGTDLGSTAPTAVGTYTVVATFAGSTDYALASDSTTFTISQATPTVAVTDADGTYNGSPFSASATVTGVSGPAASTLEGVSPTFEYYVGSGIGGTDLGSAAPTAAGTYTVVATFAGSTDYTSASDSTTFTISQATPIVAVSDADGTYNDSPFSGSATVTGVSGPAAGTLEGVSPTFEYYVGSGIDGTDLGSTAPTAAGTYTVVATFAGSTDYTSASDSTTFTISPATPTVAVTDADGAYNGSPFSASATVTGVSGPAASTLEGVSPTFEYYVGSGSDGANLGGTAPTAAGTYTVVATFAGSTDYASASDSQTFTISQATPTIAVTDNSGTYNGSPFSASATVTGLSGPAASTLEGVSPTFEYYVGSSIGGTDLGSTAPTAAGTYTVVATFPGSTDYASASDSQTFTISQATPTVAVSDVGGTFNGSPFSASATVTGLSGPAASTLEGVSPTFEYYVGSGIDGTDLGSAAPTAVGVYTVVATFVGSTDYASASDSRPSPSRRPRPPSPSLTPTAPTTALRSRPRPRLLASVDLPRVRSKASRPRSSIMWARASAAPTWAARLPRLSGTYTVVATFAGSTDYASASDSQTFTISPATPTVAVSDNSGTYNGSPFSASATVTGLSGPAAGTLEGVSPTFEYYQGSGIGGADLGSTAPTAAGTYTVVASFAGSTDYASASDSTTFTISQATPTVAVSDADGAYNGSPFSASATVTGLSDPAASTLEGVSPTFEYYVGSGIDGANLGSTAPTVAGTYTVVATFAGSTDYASASDSQTFTISPATPTVAVTDADGTYNGSPFSASATVTGLSGPAAGTLEGVSPTFEYYVGSGIGGADLGSTAPTVAGTYTVVATFAGSTDYASASDSQTFTISQATPTVAVTDNSGTYNGSPFSASATVTGLSGPAAGALEGVSPTFEYYVGWGIGGTDLGGARPRRRARIPWWPPSPAAPTTPWPAIPQPSLSRRPRPPSPSLTPMAPTTALRSRPRPPLLASVDLPQVPSKASRPRSSIMWARVSAGPTWAARLPRRRAPTPWSPPSPAAPTTRGPKALRIPSLSPRPHPRSPSATVAVRTTARRSPPRSP